MVFAAGYGYYRVKSDNTAKKREFMLKQGRTQQKQQQSLENGELAEDESSPMPARKCALLQRQHRPDQFDLFLPSLTPTSYVEQQTRTTCAVSAAKSHSGIQSPNHSALEGRTQAQRTMTEVDTPASPCNAPATTAQHLILHTSRF